MTLQRKIGEGSFASVYRVWVVNTGLQYALKKPKEPKSIDRDAWEREALIMNRAEHVSVDGFAFALRILLTFGQKHIVSLLGLSPPPNAWLRLEYMSEGTLSDHVKANNHFSRVECGQILVQSLDGLTYLHSSDPQIVHRDIKPNNILILYRRPNDIFIKLADFGLAHEGDTLMTMCGTYRYLAPEIHIAANAIRRSQREAYTALVDVWSLGVVLGELLCGLPKHGRQYYNMGVGWCETICEWVEMKSRVENDEMLSFVLDSMLRLQPSDRMTAADCYKGALTLLAQTQERSREVNGGSCSTISEDEEATIVPGGQRVDDQIGTTVSDSGVVGSSLSRYIVSNPGQQASSSNVQPPQAKATMVHVGQLLSKFRNPEDSLFYESTFGEILDGGYDEDSGTASTIVPVHHAKPQERVEQALITSVSGHAAPVEESLLSTMEWSEFDDDNGAETIIEPTETLVCNESQAPASLKRSSAAM